ncbi:MAG: copper homeostasis protein CutC [Collinsella sp.]
MGMCDNARRKTSAVFGGLSMLYEFCAENFERVPAAIDAGARRIELCDNLAVGGTTPSAGVISATTNYALEHDARVMCMIRPRGGDFHYNQDELRMMEMDLGLAVSAGVDGLVFGCCKPCAGGWALDELTLGALVMAAGCATEECKRDPIDITFHMAFDQLSPEAQLDAIDTLADCGVTRILTHGGTAGTPIEDNFENLVRLIEYADDRLTILPVAAFPRPTAIPWRRHWASPSSMAPRSCRWGYNPWRWYLTFSRRTVSPTTTVVPAPRAPFAIPRNSPISSGATVTASGSRISLRPCGPLARPY